MYGGITHEYLSILAQTGHQQSRKFVVSIAKLHNFNVKMFTRIHFFVDTHSRSHFTMTKNENIMVQLICVFL